jgi:hypothetical protein
MAGQEQRDWMALQQAFISGDVSLSEFARQHHLPLRSVQHHAQRSLWMMEKERYRIAMAESLRKDAMLQAISAKLPSVVEINAGYLSHNQRQFELLEKNVARLDARRKYDLQSQQRAVAIGESLYRCARLACGADAAVPDSMELRLRTMSEEDLQSELERLRDQDGWTPSVQ